MQKIANNNRYIALADSMQGGRSENQDYCMGKVINDDILVVTVCDGMGGLLGGSTASFMAANIIIDNLVRSLSAIPQLPERSIEDVLRQSILKANSEVYDRSYSDSSVKGMGTTTVTVVFTREAAYVAHVGDSRCYRLRGGKKSFRTNDHSRVFEFVKIGIMTEEQARTAPGNNIITRAIGTRRKVEVEIEKIGYNPSDRFILCSDGVWNVQPEQELINVFTTHEDTEKEVNHIMVTTDNIGKESGHDYDNFTVIIVDTKQRSKYHEPFLPSMITNISKWIKNKFKK